MAAYEKPSLGISEVEGVTIHSDLVVTIMSIYNLSGIECSELLEEGQNAEYGAYLLKANSGFIRFRVAKITPTKVGQFVTLWQRIEGGKPQPYDASEPVEYFVISARDGNKLGHFVFPKSALILHDIVSHNGKGGKRGMRVYPSWDKPTSRQAQNTQKWQLAYFLGIPINEPTNIVQASMLYNQINST